MNTNDPEDDELADEYDFSQGERGRLMKRLGRGYDPVIDENEDQPVHVSAKDVRAGQAALDARRKPKARRGAWLGPDHPIGPARPGGSSA